ncbi:MAG: dihydroorotate dehydrogenase electron transfer subunit [Sedimentisphaerales bacterium]|nr:dihydroorotate dehydrogenase electron transfer subunit [Sedimentisphaerales bacterium]
MSRSKAIATAEVISNARMGPRFHRLKLKLTGEGSGLFAHFNPGQFAEFDLRGVALPKNTEIPPDLVDKSSRNMILRRPLSFADVMIKDGEVFVIVLYLVAGPATLRMTTLHQGDQISLIGPLGRGFWVPDDKTTAIIIAGGMGAPPIQHLGKHLTIHHPNIRTIAFAGAKTRANLPFGLTKTKLSPCLDEFARDDIESFIATDDGSIGVKGYVTDCLANWLRKTKFDRTKAILYACGPDPMLAAVAKLAAKENLDCQVSLERIMGCGIGVCQSCVVESKQDNASETSYKLCCQDGPVFDSKEIVWK